MNRSFRYRGAVALTCAAAMASAGLASTGVAGASPPASGTVRLAGSVAADVSTATPTGAVPTGQQATVQLWMKPDTAGATAYANEVSTPGSAGFHHYLSPAAYTARFGAGAAAAGAVATWLSGRGFTDVTVGSQRDYVRASGSVGTAESAFAVRINRYQIRDSSGTVESITANDRDITLPAGLAANVIGVTGLDNAAPQTFHAQKSVTSNVAAASDCSSYYGQRVKTGLPAYKGATSFPTALCGYTGAQLRKAYA